MAATGKSGGWGDFRAQLGFQFSHLVNEILNNWTKEAVGTNLVLGPPEKFYRRNPSGTFRDVH